MERAERETLALTLLIAMEARGEPIEGQIAVAWTVRNRVARPRWWGRTVLEVITKQYQYEGYTTAQRVGIFESLSVATDQHRWVAEGVLRGWLPDPTHGATHFHAVAIHPEWAERIEFIEQIGGHRFYREV